MRSARVQGRRPDKASFGSGRRRLALALSVAMLGLGTGKTYAGTAVTGTFFDWLGETTAPVAPPYVTAPTLDDTSAAGVKAFLNGEAAAGRTLAVKVRFGVTLSPATISLIFDDAARPINFIFSDYEGPTTVAQTAALVAQIAPTATGARIAANTSFIGNYALGPFPADPTRPTPGPTASGNSAANPFFTVTDFRNSGVNMSSESLYPGDASFRNPIAGNSTAPNIRSALFTLPIQRLTIASQNMGVGQAHVPFITRFNAFDNPAFDTDSGLPGVQFDTSKGPKNGQATVGQLPSRNDFQALALHYRMRGATSYHLLDPGVVGYTQAQEESDALTGWTNSLVGSILSTNNGRVAQLPTFINVDGTVKSIEDAGVVFSAVTNDNVATPGLALLVSNLDNSAHSVSFNTRINGATLSYTSGSLAAGSHTILRFTKSGGLWASPLVDPSFNDPTLASRDGVGIPEPASISILAIGALGVLMRRRRKA